MISKHYALRTSSATVARMLDLKRSGSTTPAVVETRTGAPFLLKFSAAGQGVRGLLTEFLATRIAGVLGCRVPPVRPLWLPADFPWQIGTDEFDDMVRRSAGWNLGVSMIAGARHLEHAELFRLPAPFVQRLVVADRLLQNMDRGERNPNVLTDATGELWAIDFGACLFLERILRRAAGGTAPFTFALAGDHFACVVKAPPPLAADLVAQRMPDAETIAGWLEPLPEEWFAGVALSRAELAAAVAAYLQEGLAVLRAEGEA